MENSIYNLINSAVGKKGTLKIPSYGANKILTDIVDCVTDNSSKIEDALTNIDYINKSLYPTDGYIEGDRLLPRGKDVKFTLVTSGVDFNDTFYVKGKYSEEYLKETIVDAQSITLGGQSNIYQKTKLIADVYIKNTNSLLFTTEIDIAVAPSDIVITKESNAPIQECLFNAGLVANEDYSLKSELEQITEDQLQPGTSASTSIFYEYRNSITHFEEFFYFTGITTVPKYLFSCELKKLYLPKTITTFGASGISYDSIDFLYAPCLPNIRARNLAVDSLEKYLESDCYFSRNNYSLFLTEVVNDYFGNTVFNFTKVVDLVIPEGTDIIGTNKFICDIQSLGLPSSVKEIDDYAFSTPTLRKIDGECDPEYISLSSFQDCKNVEIGKGLSFGLFTHRSEFNLKADSTTLYSGDTNAFKYGDVTFTSLNYFDDKSQSKTLTLSYTGLIEDLTSRLNLKYDSITIRCNLENVEFRVEYFDANNIKREFICGKGVQLTEYTRANITITPITNVEGYITPNAISHEWDFNFTYKERVDYYIQHIDGSLYTSSEGTSNGFTNSLANGVAVVRPFSGSFVIAKTDAVAERVAWGGSGKDITTESSNGYNNTSQIISALSGYTDSEGIVGAPAAEACVNYIFPDGSVGYLGSVNEGNLVTSEVESLMTQIGGRLEYSSKYGTSSTSYSGIYKGSGSYTYKSDTCYVRAFTPLFSLHLNCNRQDVKFNVSYTNQSDELKNITYTAGVYSNILPKKNSDIVITVLPGYEWAELNTTSQSINYTGGVVSATFTSALEEGVYIQHIDGSLYKSEEGTTGGFTNDAANGIAVIETSRTFVMAKDDVSADELYGGGYEKEIDMPYYTTTDVGVLDLNGVNNTNNIIEALSGYTDSNSIVGAPAAEACVNYIFPNNNTGYLPSLGELHTMGSNKEAVDSALTLIGGSIPHSDYYGSSSPGSDTLCLGLRWNDGHLGYNYRNTTAFVRAFTTIS